MIRKISFKLKVDSIDKKFFEVFEECKDALLNSIHPDANEMYEDACCWDALNDTEGILDFPTYSASLCLDVDESDFEDDVMMLVSTPIDIVRWCYENGVIPDSYEEFDFNGCEAIDIEIEDRTDEDLNDFIDSEIDKSCMLDYYLDICGENDCI